MTADRLLAIEAFAAELHRDQVDQSGVPYIEHLRGVAAGVDTESAKVVALLHDSVEDQGATSEMLSVRDVTAVEIEAIRLVSRREEDTYGQFIERVLSAGGEAGWLARAVKRADLEHNLGRMTSELEASRPDLAARYRAALTRLATPRVPSPLDFYWHSNDNTYQRMAGRHGHPELLWPTGWVPDPAFDVSHYGIALTEAEAQDRIDQAMGRPIDLYAPTMPVEQWKAVLDELRARRRPVSE